MLILLLFVNAVIVLMIFISVVFLLVLLLFLIHLSIPPFLAYFHIFFSKALSLYFSLSALSFSSSSSLCPRQSRANSFLCDIAGCISQCQAARPHFDFDSSLPIYWTGSTIQQAKRSTMINLTKCLAHITLSYQQYILTMK